MGMVGRDDLIRALVRDGATSLQVLADALGIRVQSVHARLRRMPDGAELRERIAANQRSTQVLVEAFGESKTFNAWAADPRCRVSANTVKKRLREGWDVAAALATPADSAGPQRTMTLTEAETAELHAAAGEVRSGPRVHRHTAADALELAALRRRDDLIRSALGRGTTAAEIARTVGLSHESIRRIRDARQ